MDRKELKSLFAEKFGNRESFTKDEVMEFMKPYFEFDAEKAYLKELNLASNGMIASLKDGENVRKVMMFEKEGERHYTNIDLCKNVYHLKAIRDRNQKTRDGYTRVIKKIERKIFIIQKQISIDQWQQSKLSAQ